MLENMKEAVKDGIKEALSEIFADIGKSILCFLVDIVGNVALYGGLISIILYAVGYKPAIKYPGPLLVAYILVKYIFGGVI